MSIEDKNLLIVLALIGLGSWIIVANWIGCIRYFLTKKGYSTVPFLGGILLFLGLSFVQQPFVKEYAYLAFFIDLGGIPFILINLYYVIKACIKKFRGK